MERSCRDRSGCCLITHKYQYRPAIELYDIENDRYCLNNIAGLPENTAIIERLDKMLGQWMGECGDEGQPTEMKATEHQFRNVRGQIGEIFWSRVMMLKVFLYSYLNNIKLLFLPFQEFTDTFLVFIDTIIWGQANKSALLWLTHVHVNARDKLKYI